MEPTTLQHAHDDAAHAEDDVDAFDPAEHRPSSRGLRNVVLTGVAGLTALLAVGFVPRGMHRAAMAEEERVAASDLLQVQVVPAERDATGGELSLPGSVEPLQESSMYARVNGYVRRWRVDIGARVKKGQVLAELDLPDIEEQLREAEAQARQAMAGIEQAKAQLTLARTTRARYTSLGPSGVVTQQEVDQVAAGFDVQQASLSAAEAAYGSAQATARRYRDLEAFGVITAPFDGVVTSRSAEVGQLVTAGTGQGQALFKVAEVDVVRVFAHVPQLYAAGILVGTSAPTSVREAPGRAFVGTVARTSNELDTASRTLLTEVDIPNPDGALVAGMYAQVAFDVRRQDRPLLVPATAVSMDAQGTRAAVIENGVVHWKKVVLAGDLGDRLAIATGLQEGDLVAVTPSERLINGGQVLVEAPPRPQARQP